jgi:AcrR family transcriptional regulator
MNAPETIERPQRADARRNRERILEAARAAFRARGPDASLEEIARGAGVGIGTLYRHFPNRHALVDAVFRESADALCAQAETLHASAEPREAFVSWLRASLDHAMTYRGLAASLMTTELGDETAAAACGDQTACRQLRATSEMQVAYAKEAGVLRADVEPDDVVRLVNAIALSTEDDPKAAEVADRLFALLIDGLVA